jgi:hypothetical protein
MKLLIIPEQISALTLICQALNIVLSNCQFFENAMFTIKTWIKTYKNGPIALLIIFDREIRFANQNIEFFFFEK